MHLFIKKKKRVTPTVNHALPRWKEAIDRWHSQLAELLAKQSERASLKTKKIILFSFILSMGCLCLGLLINSFQKKDHNSVVFTEPIETTVMILPPTEPILTKEEYERLLHFRRSLDSLRRTKEGRKIYDQLLLERPGLLDSLNLILSFYGQ
jgi:hypothetical protein